MIEQGKQPCVRSARDESGHALLIVLLIAVVMIIMTTAAVQVWSTVIKRDREEELIFRGKQYAMAIRLYQKERGIFPPDLKQLEEKGPKQNYVLRRPYKDPITGKDFGVIYAGPNGAPIPDEPLEGDEGDLDGDGGMTGMSGSSNVGNSAFGNPDNSGLTSQTGRGAGTGPGRIAPATTMTSGFGTPSAAGGLPIMGVHSKSKDYAIGPAKWRDLERYNQWLFLATEGQAGVPGQQRPNPQGGVQPGGVQPGGGRGGGTPNPTGGTTPP